MKKEVDRRHATADIVRLFMSVPNTNTNQTLWPEQSIPSALHALMHINYSYTCIQLAVAKYVNVQKTAHAPASPVGNSYPRGIVQ